MQSQGAYTRYVLNDIYIFFLLLMLYANFAASANENVYLFINFFLLAIERRIKVLSTIVK